MYNVYCENIVFELTSRAREFYNGTQSHSESRMTLTDTVESMEFVLAQFS